MVGFWELQWLNCFQINDIYFVIRSLVTFEFYSSTLRLKQLQKAWNFLLLHPNSNLVDGLQSLQNDIFFCALQNLIPRGNTRWYWGRWFMDRKLEKPIHFLVRTNLATRGMIDCLRMNVFRRSKKKTQWCRNQSLFLCAVASTLVVLECKWLESQAQAGGTL